MMGLRRMRVAAVLLCVLAAACTSAPAAVRETSSPRISDAGSGGTSPGPDAPTSSAAPTGAATTPPSPAPSFAVSDSASTADTPRASASEQDAEKPPLTIAAMVTPTCVRPGESLTLVVEAEPYTAVAFVAYYAGEESGAPPPWGQGHGGNDGDVVDSSGRYEATWVVSPSAPVGDGHVDVIAGKDHREASESVPFTVADPALGGC